MKRTKRAFTLIELITVMAITAILLTIITIPVVQSFNLTRAAQTYANAQERGRNLMDRISRDIRNAVAVRDNSGLVGACVVQLPGLDGNPTNLAILNAKMDLMMPAADPIYSPAGDALVNPATGKIDPTLRSPVGNPVFPAGHGSRMIRYFIGPKDPFRNYNNPYNGLLNKRNGSEDNLIVLYRAEVDLRVLSAPAVPGGQPTWVPNPDLFTIDAYGQLSDLDDPTFFTPNRDGSNNIITNDAKATRIQNWLKRCRIVTEQDHFDAILPLFDKNSRQVTYSGNIPRIMPLISFSPSRVSNETPDGMLAVRSGEEAYNSVKFGPDIFRTKFGGWTNMTASVWPSVIPADSSLPFTPSVTPNVKLSYHKSGSGRYSIYLNNAGVETQLFDNTSYQEAVALNSGLPANDPRHYPFSYALGSVPAWTGNAALRSQFIAFNPDVRTGQVTASFSITELGDFNVAPPAGSDNRPQVSVGAELVWQNDPAVAGASDATRWATGGFNTINQRFNVLYKDWDSVLPTLDKNQYCKRFAYLPVTPNADGTTCPLDPINGFPRARVVPGSEVVIGPDQNPGPNHGLPTRYSRIASGDPGVNQYKINYVDQPQPNWGTLGLSVPATYTSNDPVSALIQTQLKAGYLEFNSDPSLPLPSGNITVLYRFQFNEPNDVFAVDYDTRENMNVNLSILAYPNTSSTPDPQQITLRGSAHVGNFKR